MLFLNLKKEKNEVQNNTEMEREKKNMVIVKTQKLTTAPKITILKNTFYSRYFTIVYNGASERPKSNGTVKN